MFTEEGTPFAREGANEVISFVGRRQVAQPDMDTLPCNRGTWRWKAQRTTGPREGTWEEVGGGFVGRSGPWKTSNGRPAHAS